jgi:hypothetical protein
MTAVKAGVPAPHLATYDLQAFQDGVRKPFFGSPWVPPPKAVTTSAQAAVPPAHPAIPDLQDGRWGGFQVSMAVAKAAAPAAPLAICHGQAADAGCGVALGGKAAVHTPKALATPAKAAVLTSNAAQPDTGGRQVRHRHGGGMGLTRFSLS